MRTLLSLVFCIFALSLSLLTFEIVNSVLAAMLIGSVVYTGLELTTHVLRI